MTDRGLPLGWQWQLLILHRGQGTQQICPAHGQMHTRCTLGGAQIDIDNACMRHGAAHKRHMQHAGQREVIDVLTAPDEQSCILTPGNRLSDKGLPVNGVERKRGRHGILAVQ